MRVESLKQLICDYQETDESESEIEIVKERDSEMERMENILCEANDLYHKIAYDSQNLGFVQGMKFALDIMTMSGEGKNKELLNKLIDALENGKEKNR